MNLFWYHEAFMFNPTQMHGYHLDGSISFSVSLLHSKTT